MLRLLTAALAAALLLPASASAFLFQERGGLSSGTNGIVLGPDGNLWASESTAGTVVQMKPDGTPLARFAVGVNPTSMAVGPGGRVWVSVTGSDKLVWIDALSTTPITHDVPVPTDCGPVGIASGGDGRMYFTTPKDDCAHSSGVGFAPADGTAAGTTVQLVKPKAYDIEVSGGKLFIAAFDDGAVYRLATSATLPIEADISSPGSPIGIAADGAGNIWFTAYTTGKVGRFPASLNSGSAIMLTPAGGTLEQPFGIVAGADGKMYATGRASKNLVRIDPATNAFTFYGLGSGEPSQIVNGPDGDLWLSDTANPRLLRFVNSAPRATTGTATAASATTANLAARVDPRGNPTTVVFEYGPTTAYGSSTPAQTVPTGADPVDVQASLTGLAASTTYHVRVRATNAEGETAGADTTFTTPAAPAVLPPPPAPLLGAKIVFGWKVSRAYTRLTRLRIEKLTGGETAKVSCKGGKKKGCPFASRTYRNLRAGTKNLATSFGIKKRKLRPGAIVTITVTKPGFTGRKSTLTVRKRKAPRVVRS